MTAKQLAQMLNGAEYGSEINRYEEQMARENGLVVVFGYSDDNTEFRGAIDDEVGCYEGGTFYVSRSGFVYQDAGDDRARIDVLWCDSEDKAAWSYKTNIPHETFNIYEDGELFCVGIVFRVEDLDPQYEKKTLAAAIDKWGGDAQVIMAFEEMSELQKELCKNFRGKINEAEIADEIADVEIMLEQLKMIFEVEELTQERRYFKIARLAERLRAIK